MLVDASNCAGDEEAMRFEGLSVSFGGAAVVHDVDLKIGRGEAVGIIGESGSGKSVAFLAALGLLPSARVSGSVRLATTEILHAPRTMLETIRGRRVAMIFQNPTAALNPIQRVGTQVVEVLRLHLGMTEKTARAEAMRLFDQVRISDAARKLESYPHELSGGQSQRVTIAMALAGRPDIIVADEPTTALDAIVQAQILDLLAEVRRDAGCALALISHDLAVVARVCRRVYVMHAGRVVETAAVADLFSTPRHPYSRALLAASSSLDAAPRHGAERADAAAAIDGVAHGGCAFEPRCGDRLAECRDRAPPLGFSSRSSHLVACYRAGVSDLVSEAAE